MKMQGAGAVPECAYGDKVCAGGGVTDERSGVFGGGTDIMRK